MFRTPTRIRPISRDRNFEERAKRNDKIKEPRAYVHPWRNAMVFGLVVVVALGTALALTWR